MVLTVQGLWEQLQLWRLLRKQLGGMVPGLGGSREGAGPSPGEGGAGDVEVQGEALQLPDPARLQQGPQSNGRDGKGGALLWCG